MMTPFLAGLFGFDIPPHMIAIIVPIAGMMLGGAIVISAMHFKHQQQRLWHETARIALEKGQPLPPAVADNFDSQPKPRPPRNDLRAGLILIGVGVGLFVFLSTVGAEEARFVGAIPGFIGVALVLYTMLSNSVLKKDASSSHPPQS